MLMEEQLQKRQLSPSVPRRSLLAMTSGQHELAQMNMGVSCGRWSSLTFFLRGVIVSRTPELSIASKRLLLEHRAFVLKSRMPQSECTMNIFYIIGVVVVIIFVAGFFGLHA
jgi:hypothetical protein